MKFGGVSATEDNTGKSLAFFCKDSSFGLTKKFVDAMILWSHNHNNQDVRVCLHQNRQDRYHQMIVLHHKGIYRRPHKEDRSESYHMIRGTMRVILFNSDGSIREHLDLSTKSTFLYRTGADQWHVTIPLSPIVIFHESKAGPYTGNQVTFPPWAPLR